MQERQAAIARALRVVPPFADQHELVAEIDRRVSFIGQTLKDSGLRTLVLGISGGVDSSLAGRMAQLAVERLRAQTGQSDYRFIAVRLPYLVQQDEADAQAALQFIAADEVQTVNIGAAVQQLDAAIALLGELPPAQADVVRGNIKARLRMVAQFAIANARAGLVIGTDHAAEAVMGFFTKFGDGACDLAPLTGLVKGQIRGMARYLGASPALAGKTPTADLEELAPLKPDEVSYGVTYDEIDAFLHGQPVSQSVHERIVRLYDGSQHKRELPRVP